MLDLRDLRPGSTQFGVRLHQFKPRAIARLVLSLGEGERLFSRFQRRLGDTQLFIERKQRHVARCHRRCHGQVRRGGGGLLGFH